MLQPIKNFDEYKRIRESLRERFDTERTGDQYLFREQSKILQPLIKPLISSQQHTIKAIENNNDMTALTKELQRRNDQVDLLSQQPFYLDPLSSIMPQTSSPVIKIDLDVDLNETDRENLQDMSLELPSVVN